MKTTVAVLLLLLTQPVLADWAEVSKLAGETYSLAVSATGESIEAAKTDWNDAIDAYFEPPAPKPLLIANHQEINGFKVVGYMVVGAATLAAAVIAGAIIYVAGYALMLTAVGYVVVSVVVA